MTSRADWRWRFLGFESAQQGRPVQVWFDSLPGDAKAEICDLLGYLEKMTASRWRKPEFDPLDGEGGISELRPVNIHLEQGGRLEVATYRLYGFFGSGEQKDAYIFLHGTQKGKRNDKHGKRIAKDRFNEIECGRATVHEFKF